MDADLSSVTGLMFPDRPSTEMLNEQLHRVREAKLRFSTTVTQGVTVDILQAGLCPEQEEEWGELCCHVFFGPQTKHHGIQIQIPTVWTLVKKFAQCPEKYYHINR